MKIPKIDWQEYMKRFNKWLESDEGKGCTEGTTSGVYLENRLKNAMKAGNDILLAMLKEAK